MVKSLIFCTSYFESETVFYLRYKKWLAYYLSLPFSEDKDFFILDDGSDLTLADNLYNLIEGDLSPETPIEKVNFYHFKDRLTKGGGANSEGWYRSFLFAYDIATMFGYDKIIHIESDLYLLTPGICDYINDLNTGWVSFRCPTYRFPESSIQIINKDCYDKLSDFKDETLDKGLENMHAHNAEWIIPFTHVEEDFVGDRYGERREDQNADMDYYAQAGYTQHFEFDLAKKMKDKLANVPFSHGGVEDLMKLHGIDPTKGGGVTV